MSRISSLTKILVIAIIPVALLNEGMGLFFLIMSCLSVGIDLRIINGRSKETV